jgi:DNA-binding GntR family transcriptional regulator
MTDPDSTAASTPGAGPAANATATPAAQRAYDETKLRIIRGDLPGGTWLSENTVCEQLGLSRTPVHEAFLRLAAEELLTLEPRKGAVVRPMSPNEVDDIIEMREAIETSAARRAIERDDPELDAVLRELVAEQRACIARRDIDGFAEADEAFHYAVVVAAQNPIAAHFSRLLRDRAQRLRHSTLRVRAADLGAILDEHRQLADAVEARDAETYAAVMHRHLGILRGAL